MQDIIRQLEEKRAAARQLAGAGPPARKGASERPSHCREKGVRLAHNMQFKRKNTAIKS